MYEFPDKPLGIFSIIGNVFKLAICSFKKTWLILGFFSVCFFLSAQKLSTLNYDLQLQLKNSSTAKNLVSQNLLIRDSGLTFAIVVLCLIVMLFLSIMLIKRLNEVAKGPRVDKDTSIISLWFRIFFASIIIAVLFSAIGFVFGFGAHLLTNSGLSGLLMFFAGLLIFFFMVLFIVNMPAIIFENLGPWKGIKRSSQLVWGNWWHTFWAFFVTAFCISIVEIVIIVLFLLIDAGTGNLHLSTLKSQVNYPISLQIVVSLMRGFIHMPLIFSLLYVIYRNLKLRAHSK